MVISAIGRMAAKAAIKKISNASAKKAQAFMRADKKKTDIMKQGLPMSAITMAEGSGRASGLFKNMKKMISVMPAASGWKIYRHLVWSENNLECYQKALVLKFVLSSKVKNALDLLKKKTKRRWNGD
jgi:hypothetical protein